MKRQNKRRLMSPKVSWQRAYGQAVTDLSALRDRIDSLGDAGVSITSDDRADQLACYASNSIEGTLALLRELNGHVVPAQKRTAK